jgi:hypothetical protein
MAAQIPHCGHVTHLQVVPPVLRPHPMLPQVSPQILEPAQLLSHSQALPSPFPVWDAVPYSFSHGSLLCVGTLESHLFKSFPDHPIQRLSPSSLFYNPVRFLPNTYHDFKSVCRLCVYMTCESEARSAWVSPRFSGEVSP